MTPRRWMYAIAALLVAGAGAFYALRPEAPEHRTRRIDPEASKDLVDTMGGKGGKTNQRIDPEASKDLIDTVGGAKKR